MDDVTYWSAFAGIGGFEQAWNDLGMRCTLQIENDPHAAKVLAHHFPGTPRLGDIANVDAADAVRRFGRPRVLVGGFPCLGTSLGQVDRIGLDDARSGYFFPFYGLARDVRPDVVVIENPVGLLTSPGRCKATCNKGLGCEWCGVDRTGWDMHTVVSLMADLGYGWAYRVVDPREHDGVQRRERVILVFTLGTDPTVAGEVLGLCGPGGAAVRPSEQGPADGPGAAGGARPDGWDSRVALADRLLSEHGQRVWSKVSRPRASAANGGFETWRETGVANTLTGFDHGNAARQPHLVLEQDGRVRTLTIEEWEAVSDVPTGWTGVAGASDAQRAKMLGNMMNPRNAYGVGMGVLDVLRRYF